MNARKLIPAILTALCGLILSATPALAAQHHAFSQSFGSPGAGAGQLSLASYNISSPGSSGLAVDDATHDVYVADTGNRRVDEFDPSKPSGEQFVRAWGWGVADGKAELETCTATCQAGLGGSDPGQFSSPLFIAVDNSSGPSSGDVYVADTSTSLVTKFTATGELVTNWGVSGQLNGSTNPDGPFSKIAGIAIRASGDLLVLDAGGKSSSLATRMSLFAQGGTFLEDFTLQFASLPLGFALDNSNGPSSGDIYTVYYGGKETLKYSPAGLLEGEPDVEYGRGLAVDSSNGDLYVSHAADIASYGPSGGPMERFGSAEPAGGELQGPAGLGVDPSDHTVYVADAGSQRIDVFASVLFPGVSTTAAGNLQPESVTLNGVLDPDGTTPDTEVTNCQFEYVEDATYKSFTGILTPDEIFASFAAVAPCLNPDGATTAPLAPDTADHAVHADVTGLQAGTAYDVRLRATNANGTEASSPEVFSTLFPFVPPTIESISASNVSSVSADLEAQINPNHYAVSYRFEYVDNATYEQDLASGDGFQHASRAPAGAEAISSSSGTSQAIQQLLLNLDPGTTYRYRLVADNSHGGPQTSAVQAFTTQTIAPFLLPDGRAWEMVSPPDKRGFPLEAIGSENGDVIQAAADGGAMTYGIQGPPEADPKGNRNLTFSQILSKRTASGWSSLDVETPHESVNGLSVSLDGFDASEYLLFSPDLTVGLLMPPGDTPLSPQATESTPYLRQADGEYTPLVTPANVPPGTEFGQQVPERGGQLALGALRFAGASPDLSHVVLSSSPPLVEGIAGTEGRENLFEWFDGSLRLVSVLPDGKAATEAGRSAGLGSIGDDSNDVQRAVSDDGSRVFWSQGSEFLYVRDVGKGETVQLNTIEAGAQGGEGRVKFAIASSDGSKAFFLDESRLTSDSTAVPGGEGKSDLYMCVVGEVAGRLACQLKDLSVDHNPGESADVLGGSVIAAGEDGRYVYFVANGVLAPGATPGNCNGEGTRLNNELCNLYVYDTVTDKTTLVAQLSGNDRHDWRATSNTLLIELTAGASPDGRYLAFMSERSLTGYDNVDVNSGQPDVEVYLYDAGTARLTCASCNPSGARPSGVFDTGVYPGLLVDRPGNWEGHWLAGSIPGWTSATKFQSFYRSRYLSDSGRLFFDSSDALVPADSNGTQDVYEYEPAGVGSCDDGAGCVGLMSSGISGEESAFLDASESGNDVFFLTTAQLSRQDTDQALDVYDARVCSASSPCLAGPSASPPPCATADACRSAPSQQPGLFGAPASATFSGEGNPGAVLAPVVKKKAKKKVLTVAQKRAGALRRCRAKPRRKRASCEAQVRRRYRVVVKAKRSVRSSSKKRNG